MFSLILWIIALSQIYWLWRGRRWLLKAVPQPRARRVVYAGALALYALAIAYSSGWIGGRNTPVYMRPADALLSAPLAWWLASSLFAFLLVSIFWTGVSLVRAPVWFWRKLRAPRPSAGASGLTRRGFLGNTAAVVAGTPFVAGAYGLLRGRLNLETPLRRIRLPRLPREFEGFRIAQLSDIHIGPFMTEEEIRKYVAITNSLKPDLVALTGDFVTWDPTTQEAVVRALSGLRAPYGLYGCLGNHDAWAGVEDSITELFRQAGIHILRQESAAIRAGAALWNLMGIDFASQRPFGPRSESFMRRYLEDLGGLMDRNAVNILLSHNPDTFDRAASMGIDLSLAGHTHGGQAALEFISPQIAPSRIVTPYVSGLFEKPGGQLYVNRGLGTIGVPIRIGAPPEITIFELTRS